MPKRARPIRIEGDLAYVPLTKGYEAVIDAADVPLVEGFNWFSNDKRRKDGTVRTVYAERKERLADGKYRNVKMHRSIMKPKKGLDVDHIDGDGLNCRRGNMRVARRSQNLWNQGRSSRNTSGVKGVSWNRSRQTWTAQLQVNRRIVHVGYFNSIEEAAAAYAEAVPKYHGEFGRIDNEQ